MIRIIKPEIVEWLGEGPLRMLVRGRSGTYLVDLSELGGNGWCGCQDFELNRMPKLRQGRRGEITRCKHIRTALEYLGRLVAQVARMHPTNPDAYYLLGKISVKRLRRLRMERTVSRYARNPQHLLGQ